MVWNLQNIIGTAEEVKAKVAASKVPSHLIEAISGELDAMGSPVRYKVDAYCQDARNPSAMTTTRNINITIVAVI